MAGRWRVLVDELRDLSTPKYRIGDGLRHLKHTIADDDDVIKDVVVEIGFDEQFQVTKSFGVPADGNVKLGAVLFVKAPPAGRPLTFRVLKSHRIQKDALIGEAQVKTTAGKQKLTLTRNEKPRGYLFVEVSDGLPGSAAGGGAQATTLPAGALKRESPAPQEAAGEAAASGAARGGGCMDCVNGLLGLLGLVDQSKAFLEKKAKDPAYKVMPSGLIYKVLKKGAGSQHPNPRSSCDCHYEGRLANGTVFDASRMHGGPQNFTVGDVVKGWTEALQLMVEGDKFELILPPSIAYRDQAIRGEDGKVIIPANSVLVFEMELLRIRGSNWGGGRH